MEKKTRNCTFRTDLTGKVYGQLTVLSYAGKGTWNCQCSCGNQTIVDTRNLNSGHTQSCGCLVSIKAKTLAKDMTNYENEYIKVLKRSTKTTKGQQAYWICLCKHCGNEFEATGAHIRENKVFSCGCIRLKGFIKDNELYRSLNEYKITKMLQDNNVEFSREYTFPDLKSYGNRKLRFDFAVLKNGKLSHLIEFNGLQHYKSENLFDKYFENIKQNDIIKKEYCKKHNIELRIIKYNDNYTINDLI